MPIPVKAHQYLQEWAQNNYQSHPEGADKFETFAPELPYSLDKLDEVLKEINPSFSARDVISNFYNKYGNVKKQGDSSYFPNELYNTLKNDYGLSSGDFASLGENNFNEILDNDHEIDSWAKPDHEKVYSLNGKLLDKIKNKDYQHPPENHHDKLFNGVDAEGAIGILGELGKGYSNPNFFHNLDADKVLDIVQHATPEQLNDLEDIASSNFNRAVTDTTPPKESKQFWGKLLYNTKALTHGINSDDYNNGANRYLRPDIVQKEQDHLDNVIDTFIAGDQEVMPAMLGKIYHNPVLSDASKEKIQRNVLEKPERILAFKYHTLNKIFSEIKNPEIQKLALEKNPTQLFNVNDNLIPEVVQGYVDDQISQGKPIPLQSHKYLADRHLEHFNPDDHYLESKDIKTFSHNPNISDDALLKVIKKHSYLDVAQSYADRFPDQYNEKSGSNPDSDGTPIPPLKIAAHPQLDYLKRIKGAIEDSGLPAMHKRDLEKQGLNIPNDLLSPKGEVSIESVNRATDLLPKTEYNVNFGKWNGAQRHNIDIKQDVLRVNITNDMLKKMRDEGVLNSFNKVNEMSRRSGHPIDLHTLGWARLDLSSTGHAHIDEIQSDLGQNLVDAVSKLKQEGKMPDEYKDLQEGDLKKIQSILAGGHEDINHAVFSATHQTLRQMPNIKTVSMDTPLDQAKQAGLDLKKPLPVHAIKTYKERPKKAGYKEVSKNEVMPLDPARNEDAFSQEIKLIHPQLQADIIKTLYNNKVEQTEQHSSARDNAVKHMTNLYKLTPDQSGRVADAIDYHKRKLGLGNSEKIPHSSLTTWEPDQKVQLAKLVKSFYEQIERLKYKINKELILQKAEQVILDLKKAQM